MQKDQHKYLSFKDIHQQAQTSQKSKTSQQAQTGQQAEPSQQVSRRKVVWMGFTRDDIILTLGGCAALIVIILFFRFRYVI